MSDEELTWKAVVICLGFMALTYGIIREMIRIIK